MRSGIRNCFRVLALLAFAAAGFGTAQGQRVTVSLNGTWQIQDSVSGDEMPTKFEHTVPVPGLAHSAVPAFAEVDRFQSRELLSNLVRRGQFSASDYEKLGDSHGLSLQQRNYFWYSRSFRAPKKRGIAVIKVSKAQFGIVVFLNGQKLGEHYPCFTAAYFDATKAIRWDQENRLVIRVGAHPNVLPKNVSQGTDFEKNLWTPGIYDDVDLYAMDGPVIDSVQTAARIDRSEVLVETVLRNQSSHTVTAKLQQEVRERKSHELAGSVLPQTIVLGPDEVKRIQQVIHIRNQHLWTPEDPFLYDLHTRTAGDSVSTRFGMRDFHFDTVTQRAYLNGHPYFLRGSNITLHRFFEDPDSGTLPWDEAWLHKLLVEIPKQMHWNAFRFCIGPVPDRWLQIADESGLLIENEYMVWVGHPSWRGLYRSHYDSNEMIGEFSEWVRDNWNHPSVATWDANNESWAPEFGEQIIPAVRNLDLSKRPWENGFNAPVDANDPVQDHPYLFADTALSGKWHFRMTDLQSMLGLTKDGTTAKTAHAMILNEYGWLWLNRDGSPTLLTDKLYPMLLGPDSTKEQRFKMQAYLLAGETEFWRAYRRYAGVLQFVYLATCGPTAFTCDNFQDVKTLTLEPHYADYMAQAFKPVGVYLNFWQPELTTNQTQEFTILMVNDASEEQHGTLRVSFVREGSSTEENGVEVPFEITPLGAQSYNVTVQAPSEPGNYTIRAAAIPTKNLSDATVSRRWVTLKVPSAATSSNRALQ